MGRARKGSALRSHPASCRAGPEGKAMNEDHPSPAGGTKDIGCLGIVALCVAIVGLVLISRDWFAPSPAEVKAYRAETAKRAEAEREAEQNRQFHDQYLNGLCHQKAVCKKFAEVRQECATAGSFDTCVTIKLGDADAATINACTNDGEMAYVPKEMPDTIGCWVRGLRH